MTITLNVISGIILTCPVMSCNGQSAKNEQHIIDTVAVKETKVQKNFYPEMRDMSLGVKPDQLHLTLDKNKTIVYGTVMDWDIGQATVTVVAFQTGDASLYISAGQIYIGGSAHENIRKAGIAFVHEAQEFLSKAKETDRTPLPDKGCLRFYLLTNKGRYAFQETVENITNKNSEWTKLFDLGNNIISEYRTTTEK